MKAIENIAEILINAKESGAGVSIITENEKEKFISYKELYKNAASELYVLQSHGFRTDNEVILQITDTEKFLYAFWACVLGGMHPVPMQVKAVTENSGWILHIWDILKSPCMITEEEPLEAIIETYPELREYIKAKTIVTDNISLSEQNGDIKIESPKSAAEIMFSSGSMGSPKGVVLTHENIISALAAMSKRLEINSGDSFVNWMPLSHVIGLNLFHILPIYNNVNQCQISKVAFINNPTLWMEETNLKRASILISPNIGFKQFMDKYDRSKLKTWDLSCIKNLFCSAEKVSAELLSRFLGELSNCGLKETAMSDLYGMTESVLGISCTEIKDAVKINRISKDSSVVGRKVTENDVDSIPVVCAGKPIDCCNVRICGNDGKEVPDCMLGNIEISGDNITKNYYAYTNEFAKEQVFTENGWLKTGDIGYKQEGNITVTGREKDVVILNGENYYIQDIEKSIKEIAGSGVADMAVISFNDYVSDSENIAVFCIFKESPVSEKQNLILRIKGSLIRKIGLKIDYVIPISEIPRTQSGKIQRKKLLEILDNFILFNKAGNSPNIATRETGFTLDKKSVMQICADVLNRRNLTRDMGMYESGIDSIKMIEIISKLPCKISMIEFSRLNSFGDLEDYVSLHKNNGKESCRRIVPDHKNMYKPFPLTSVQLSYFSGRNKNFELGKCVQSFLFGN